MHASHTFGYIPKDLQDLRFGQSMLQAGIHEIDQTSATAVFHEKEDLVPSAFELAGMTVHVLNHVFVPLDFLHRLHLRPHTGQVLPVRHSHPLENGELMLIVVPWHADYIDVGESSLGKVLFDYYSLAANLNFCPWEKGTLRGIRRCCRGLPGGAAFRKSSSSRAGGWGGSVGHDRRGDGGDRLDHRV